MADPHEAVYKMFLVSPFVNDVILEINFYLK